MAYNTCTTCGCKKCGCSDNALTTPPPCPTPAGCPSPILCSEVFDAECVVYTGEPIMCGLVEVVPTGTSMADALVLIIEYFCFDGSLPIDPGPPIDPGIPVDPGRPVDPIP